MNSNRASLIQIVAGFAALLIVWGCIIGRRSSWDAEISERKGGFAVGRPSSNADIKNINETFIIEDGTTFEDFRETLEMACIKLRCGKVAKSYHRDHCTLGEPSLATRLKSIQFQPSNICSGKSPPFEIRRFAVLSIQHSGTTWLAGKLGSHPQISMVHEILLRFRKSGALLDQWPWQNAYFESSCLSSSTPNCQQQNNLGGVNKMVAIGFGVQGSDGWLDPDVLETILPYWKKNDFHVIILERRNGIARQLASSGVAKNNNNNTNDSSLVHLEEASLRTLKTYVDEWHSNFEKMKNSVDSAGLPIHYITYESLARDPAGGFTEIYEFLLSSSQSDPRWECREDNEGNEVLYDAVNNWTTTLGSSKGRHHAKVLKDRIDNYNESMELLSEIYPEGACMLDENCDWFY